MSDSIDLRARQFQVGGGTAAPAAGTWNVGDIYWNEVPGNASPLLWVCVLAGTPGTWRPLVPTKANLATVTTAAGAVDPLSDVVHITTGGYNITLTAPTTLQNGSVITFLNATAAAVTLVAGAGTTLYSGSAVVAGNTSAQVKAIANNYYRIA